MASLENIKSLSLKLNLPVIIVSIGLFIVLLIVGLLQSEQVRNEEIEKEFLYISESLQIAIALDGSYENLRNAIKAVARRDYIEHLVIVDPQKRQVIADSHSDHYGANLEQSLSQFTWKFLVTYLEKNQSGIMQIEDRNLRYQIMPFDRPVAITGDTGNNLLIAIYDQQESITREWQRLLYFGSTLGIGVLFMIMLNYYLQRQILIKPMQQITKIIDRQHFSDDVLLLPYLGSDELGVLTNSYNELARDRAKQARDLKEIRRYIDGITHEVPVLLAYVDTNLYYRFVNEGFQRWFGLSYKEIINKPVEKLLGPEVYKKAKPYMLQALEGRSRHYEFEIPMPGYGMRDVMVSYTPDFTVDGEVKGFFVCVEDIVERKEIENKLARYAEMLEQQVAERTRDLEAAKDLAEQANLAKTNFLANMSHELRTPMHGIISFAKLGLSRGESVSPEKLESYFRNIQISGDRLLNLLNDLLDLSRIEAGKIELNMQMNDVHALLVRCREEFDAKLNEREINLHIEAPKKRIMARFDYQRICQVVINLIGNAIKFSSTRSTISIYCRKVDDQVQVQVEDSGIGIATDEYETIFSKFTQSKSTRSGTGMGSTGLGLAICRELILAHGGKIWVESKINKGSSFYFNIPLDQ